MVHATSLAVEIDVFNTDTEPLMTRPLLKLDQPLIHAPPCQINVPPLEVTEPVARVMIEPPN